MDERVVIEGRGAGESGAPTELSKDALCSLILALLPTGCTQLVAVPLAISAIAKIKRSQGRLTGMSLAVLALVLAPLVLLRCIPLAPRVAAIVLPGLIDSGFSGNESSAIHTLRLLTTAQEQFRQQVLVDQDGDGRGEYGTLGELSGIEAMRVTGQKCSMSPFIAAVLGVKDARGVAQKSGYCFRLYLATAKGPARAEGGGAATESSADADNQEVRWCCYAWPNSFGQSGRWVYFADHAGRVYATAGKARAYSVHDPIPAPEAAYDAAGPNPRNLDAKIGLAAAGLQSGDGNTWVPVGN